MVKKILKIAVYVTGVLYCLMLFSILFLRNSGYFYEWTMWDYFKAHVNIIPFSTIISYVKGLLYGTMNVEYPILNLFGNLIMFVPFTIYLSCVSKKSQTWKRNLGQTLVILLLVEMAQLVFRVGSFDIDDLILNMCGAAIGFGIWKSKLGQKVYRYVFE